MAREPNDAGQDPETPPVTGKVSLPLRGGAWGDPHGQRRARRARDSRGGRGALAEDGAEHVGWFCVRTDPFPCPAPDCSFVAVFMTAAHLVLVWEERDDPNLLRHAQRAKEVGRNPRIISYENDFGPSASYYAWEAAGRPVHGVRGK